MLFGGRKKIAEEKSKIDVVFKGTATQIEFKYMK
jgi:hypothetical protein